MYFVINFSSGTYINKLEIVRPENSHNDNDDDDDDDDNGDNVDGNDNNE